MEPDQIPDADWQSERSLLDCLYYLYTSGTASDVAFVVNGGKEQILAHKTILVSRSSVFCAMLDDPTISKWEITLLDTQQHIFSLFLRYLYTDTIDLTVDLATSLLPLARQYCVNHLIRKCETFLKENFASQNAVMFVQNSRLPDADTQEDDMEDGEDMAVESDDETSHEELPSSDQDEKLPTAMDDCMKTKSEVTEIDQGKLHLDGDENGYKHLVDADGSDDKHLIGADDNGNKHFDIADADGEKHLIDSDEDDSKYLEDQDSEKHLDDQDSEKHLDDQDSEKHLDGQDREKHLTDEEDKHLLEADAHQDIPLKTVSIPSENLQSPVVDTPVMEEASAMDLTIDSSTSKVPSERPSQQKQYNMTPAYSGANKGTTNEKSTSKCLQPITAVLDKSSTLLDLQLRCNRSNCSDNTKIFALSGIVSDRNKTTTEKSVSSSELGNPPSKKLIILIANNQSNANGAMTSKRKDQRKMQTNCTRKGKIDEISEGSNRHGNYINKISDGSNGSDKVTNVPKGKCEYCSEIPSDMRVHVAICHPLKGPYKPPLKKKKALDGTELVNNLFGLCHICGKGFDRRVYLWKHLSIHSAEKHLTCHLCGDSFRQDSALRQHVNLHKATKQHRCPICDRGFDAHRYMTRHVKIHISEKLFACNVCGKKFKTKERADAHMKRHRLVKPYKRKRTEPETEFPCEICRKIYKNQVWYTKHLESHEKSKSSNGINDTETEPVKRTKTKKQNV